MKKILFIGYFGFNNIGDDLLLLSQIEYFYDKYSISVLFNSDKTAIKNMNTILGNKKITLYDRWNIISIIKAIYNNDTIIFGGGNIFQDKTSKLSCLYYIFLWFISYTFFKDIIFLSQGIGEIKSNTLNKIVTYILKKNRLNLLRDNSFQYKNTLKIVDFVFLREFFPKKRVINSNYICINIRKNIRFDDKFILQLIKNIKSIYNKRIVFIPMQFNSDLNYIKHICSKLKLTDNITILEKYDINNIINLLYYSDMNIGMRLHFNILSIKLNKKTIGIPYDKKVENIFNELKNSNLIYNNDYNYLKSAITNYNHFTIELLKEKISKTYEILNDIKI